MRTSQFGDLNADLQTARLVDNQTGYKIDKQVDVALVDNQIQEGPRNVG
jgi:hypothetical protein